MVLEQIGFTTNGEDIELEAWLNKNNGVITYFYNAPWLEESIVYQQFNIKEFEYIKNEYDYIEEQSYNEDYPTYEEYFLHELILDMAYEFALIEDSVKAERYE